nr:hypothetical protein GCM10020093_055090 [Planobispora longispora]
MRRAAGAGQFLRHRRPPRELAFNARLAAEFGAPVIVVVGAHADAADEIAREMRTGYQVFSDLGCTVLAVIANRVPPGMTVEPDLPVPCYMIPEHPSLSAPTVEQVARAVQAKQLQGDEEGLTRDVTGFVFGGATIPVFLEHLVDGALVITPGTGPTCCWSRWPRRPRGRRVLPGWCSRWGRSRRRPYGP